MPSPAEPIAMADTDGKSWNLADHKGRNVVVLFYLGGKCAHCMQQLQEFGKQIKAFEAIGTDIVAVGTDDLEAARLLKSNADGIKFPMPFLADPTLAVFRKYQAFDDFEASRSTVPSWSTGRATSGSSGSPPTRSSTSSSSRARRRE